MHPRTQDATTTAAPLTSGATTGAMPPAKRDRRRSLPAELLLWVGFQWGCGRSAPVIVDELRRRWGVVWKPVTVYTRMHKAGLTGGRKWRGGMTLQVALTAEQVEVFAATAEARGISLPRLLELVTDGLALEGPEAVTWFADRAEGKIGQQD